MVDIIFSKCCLCIDLRAGSIIIGYLQLISIMVFIGLISSSLSSGTPITFSYQGSMSVTYYNTNMHKPVSSQVDYRKVTTEPNSKLMVVLLSMLLLMLIIGFVLVLVLLFGLHLYKTVLVKAYIYYALICQIISVTLWLVRFSSRPINVPAAISHIFFTMVAVYCLLVVKSYYNKMKENSGRKRSD